MLFGPVRREGFYYKVVIQALFPPHRVRNVDSRALFRMKELVEAVFSMENKKAPGFEDIPTEVYKQTLCMLDTSGKVLEKLVRSRLAEVIHAAVDLCPR